MNNDNFTPDVSEEEYVPVSIAEDDEQPDDADERYLSNASRIRGQLAEEGVTEQKKYTKKLSFFAAIGDFFYHNRFECICVAVILAVIGIGALLRIEKTYDYRVAVYTYDSEITKEELANIADVFRGYGRDIDGDGKVTVWIKHYHPYIGSYIPKYIAGQKLYDNIFGDRSNIFILTDAQSRDRIFERFGDYNFERLCGDSRWVSIRDTEFDGGQQIELGLMMFRAGSYAMDIQDVQKRHAEAEEMLALIEQDYPELFDYGK